jgi:glycosyltransferase involved in cell wall biosynthesis
MASFILIDHSLKGVGGHHYEYAVHILQAAEAAGYQVVLATHRRFRDRCTLPPHWQVHQLFHHHTYSPYSMNFQGGVHSTERHHRTGPAALPWRQRLARRWHRRLQRRRIDRFAGACQRLFRDIDLEPDDQVFLPTLSDFDLVGLVQFLESDWRTLAAAWHLQFHFNFLDGRPPDYHRQQGRIATLRRRFEESLSVIPDHRLHFYSTTRQMASQYNQLRVAPFQLLPYPVNAVYREPADSGRHGPPLRVTCAGGIRPEKGQAQLAPLVQELWDDLFATGRLQLLIQSKKSRFRITRPGDQGGEIPMGRWPAHCTEALVDVPHPLGTEDYAQLVRSSDIGLFLYDGHQYYARCAGILVEMLMAGVPVIVPAGCWLAEQIAAPTYAHLDRLSVTLPEVPRLRPGAVRWREVCCDSGQAGSRPADLVCGDRHTAATAELPIPTGATDLLLTVRWVRPTALGTYLRCVADTRDADGKLSSSSVEVVGQRAGGRSVPILIRLPGRPARVRVALSNAYDDAAITLRDVEVRFLSAADESGGSCAAGAVGRIAANTREIPAVLRDMVAHYDHYRETAAQFARQWGQAHDPRRCIAILTGQATAEAPDHDQFRAA